jgi:Protein of unknown function, DUF547
MKHTKPNMQSTRRRSLLLAGLASAAAWLAPATSHAQAFDHGHAAWTALLKKHVVLLRGGQGSQVSYAGFAADKVALSAYTTTLAAVSREAFNGFSKPQRMAFLINAYNAYTVQLILTKYPDLKSIKDIGSLLSNPWKQKVAPLLGTVMTLDGIEHDTLRVRGAYDDPRIHFAVNCASIGCPMLREEAFTADKLDAQLDQQAQRFLSDRSRNRYNASSKKLEVSKIFDWYGEDFKLGHRGINSLDAYLAKYADVMAESPADKDLVRAGGVGISFLDYDWKLNDAKR